MPLTTSTNYVTIETKGFTKNYPLLLATVGNFLVGFAIIKLCLLFVDILSSATIPIVLAAIASAVSMLVFVNLHAFLELKQAQTELTIRLRGAPYGFRDIIFNGKKFRATTATSRIDGMFVKYGQDHNISSTGGVRYDMYAIVIFNDIPKV